MHRHHHCSLTLHVSCRGKQLTIVYTVQRRTRFSVSTNCTMSAISVQLNHLPTTVVNTSTAEVIQVVSAFQVQPPTLIEKKI